MAQSLFPFIWPFVRLIWLLFQLVLHPSLTHPNQFHCLNVTLLIKLNPLKHLYSQSFETIAFSFHPICCHWSTFQTDGDCSNPMVAQLSDIATGGCLNCLKSCHFIGILLFGIRSPIVAWMLNGHAMALGSCIVSFCYESLQLKMFWPFLRRGGGGGGSRFNIWQKIQYIVFFGMTFLNLGLLTHYVTKVWCWRISLPLFTNSIWKKHAVERKLSKKRSSSF